MADTINPHNLGMDLAYAATLTRHIQHLVLEAGGAADRTVLDVIEGLAHFLARILGVIATDLEEIEAVKGGHHV